VKATLAFDEVIDKKIPRISLIDTFADEKFAALEVAEALGERLAAVRLDTPASRRGSFFDILSEVRWELDLRGFENVDLFVSGGINETAIHELNPVADGYGIGTWISAAPVVDFSMDIVEIGGVPLAKRGKSSAAKQVLRCAVCHQDDVVPLHKADEWPETCPDCGADLEPLLVPWMSDGQPVGPQLEPAEIRERTLERIAEFGMNGEDEPE